MGKKHAEPAGDARAMDEVCKAAMPVREVCKAAMPVRDSGTRERRRRSEDEADEADEGRRAGGASAVDNGNKAAVPVGGSGNSM